VACEEIEAAEAALEPKEDRTETWIRREELQKKTKNSISGTIEKMTHTKSLESKEEVDLIIKEEVAVASTKRTTTPKPTIPESM